MNDFIQKNAAAIALLVSIIALAVAVIPQYKKFIGSSAPTTQAPAPGGAPGGMPGMGGGRMGGMGGMPGMGGMGGAGGMRREMSEELKALFAERLSLYDDAIKNASAEEAAKLQCERDIFRVQAIRQARGGFRVQAGLTEAFLKFQNSKKCAAATPLCRNQAAIDYQKALDNLRGGPEAFLDAVRNLADYPATPLTDADIEAMLDAEAPMRGGMGGMPGMPPMGGATPPPPAEKPAN